jgi:beta-xylosidase
MKTESCAWLLALCLSAPYLPTQRQILPDFHADPTARVFAGRVYVYPSHDLAGSKYWDMVDWHAFSSDEPVTWRDHGVIFSLHDITWAKRDARAPYCVERNGRFFRYFPADEQIGVAVADTPTRPFKDALGHPLINRREAGIFAFDPGVFIDDDGQAHLFFGGSSQLGGRIATCYIGLALPYRNSSCRSSRHARA